MLSGDDLGGGAGAPLPVSRRLNSTSMAPASFGASARQIPSLP
jgi:hypothetical protein